MQDQKISQSTYQDYNKASQDYDAIRKPVGLKQIIASLKQHNKNSKLEKVVDIGCGTGNYLLGMRQQFSQATGVQPNEGMLSKFTSKIKQLKLQDKITLINANAQSIPLPDNTFDGAIATLTIHHHGSKENKQKFLNQVYRILKPGGVFVINHCYDQTLKAPWYLHFSKKVLDSMADKCGSKEFMIELGENAGLKFKQLIPIKNFFGDDGNFGKSLLKKEGRQRISIFALLNEEEDQEFEKWARDLFENGKMEQFVQENCQKAIDTVGYTGNFVFCKEVSQ